MESLISSGYINVYVGKHSDESNPEMAYLAAVSAVGIFVTCILGGREP